MASSTRAWSWFAVAALAACSADACSSNGGGGAGASGGGGGGAGGAGAHAGAGGSAGGGGTTGLGGAGGQGIATYTVQFPPTQVAAGVENTQCVLLRLGNAAPIHVGQIHTQLGPGTVQMIVYAVADTTEQTTPFDCTAMTTLQQPPAGTKPLTVVQNPDETLQYPSGVGVAVTANQMMRIELHYANANPTNPLTVQATSTLTTIPDAAFQSEASLMIIDDASFSIQPNASFTIGSTFCPFPASVAAATFFAATSEQHRLGVMTQLWAAISLDDPGRTLYTNTNWTMPPLTTLSPVVPGTTGAGFKYSCEWQNTTTSTVTPGPGASNELCYFVAYYYPSQGAIFCVKAGSSSFICSTSTG
jgi:hypothetical protein